MGDEMDRRPLQDLSYGLYIVTSKDGKRLNGQIVNTVIQVTSKPPRLGVIIHKQNLTHEFIKKSKVFGVTVLEESVPMTFIGPFGFRSGREIDKFSKVKFKAGATGCPLVVEHALSVLEAEVVDEIDVGSHTIFIGDAVHSEVIKPGRPLTYQFYHEILKGNTPKNSPMYIKEK
jgi:ferric-chelate reductase [NAD(P)H]